jgi:hypothetical protein
MDGQFTLIDKTIPNNTITNVMIQNGTITIAKLNLDPDNLYDETYFLNSMGNFIQLNLQWYQNSINTLFGKYDSLTGKLKEEYKPIINITDVVFDSSHKLTLNQIE